MPAKGKQDIVMMKCTQIRVTESFEINCVKTAHTTRLRSDECRLLSLFCNDEVEEREREERES
jgi:hypothetical protein